MIEVGVAGENIRFSKADRLLAGIRMNLLAAVLRRQEAFEAPAVGSGSAAGIEKKALLIQNLNRQIHAGIERFQHLVQGVGRYNGV